MKTIALGILTKIFPYLLHQIQFLRVWSKIDDFHLEMDVILETPSARFFFLLLCLILLYLHGRNTVLKAIYGKTPIHKEFVFSRIPKYVTLGELVSIIVILAGVVFAIAGVIVSGMTINGGESELATSGNN
jgi:hypothetical protein